MKKRLNALILALTLLVLACGYALAQSEKPDLLGDFETTDINGEAVTQSLIRDAELTFVNVWGTFCDPCISEMPDLGALATEYEGRVQFIGIVTDTNIGSGTDRATVDLAKQIVETTGADTFIHLIPSDGMLNNSVLRSVQVIPTSFFVDSQGRQVGYAYQGAQSADAWRTIINEALAEIEE